MCESVCMKEHLIVHVREFDCVCESLCIREHLIVHVREFDSERGLIVSDTEFEFDVCERIAENLAYRACHTCIYSLSLSLFVLHVVSKLVL